MGLHSFLHPLLCRAIRRRRESVRVFTSGRCGERGRSTLHGVSLLGISAEAGESGSVVRLSGEADLSDVGQLGDALSALISSGARHLTVDLSGLRFADSAAIGTLVEAHLALKRQGGTLELAELQPEVARTLSLLGVDQVIPVRPQADPVPAEAGTGSSLPDAYRSTRPVRRAGVSFAYSVADVPVSPENPFP